jgi:hemerythrin-like metal-binding protein
LVKSPFQETPVASRPHRAEHGLFLWRSEADMATAWNDNLSVGIVGMDEHHKVFLDLLGQLNEAAAEELSALYDEFERHLAEHFGYEEALMREHGFPAFNEHHAEHLRVLAEARDMRRSLARRGPTLIRQYLRDRLPEWFELHRNTMDMATAAFLKNKGLA